MLKIIRLEKLNQIRELMIEVETDSEVFYKQTLHRLLDIFPRSLTAEEAEPISFAYADLHLKHEYNQLSFLEALWSRFDLFYCD
ncbi:hypothetical protein [Marinilactibacillus piezotolerans]|uniref:hypothetical protein n=1 Tax=Marinilactibacillus piezotolerans TaxID=258723 RepID=UPI0009AF8600|nr:hypothetical protein [Marinilactibacillus piezotolerans]